MALCRTCSKMIPCHCHVAPPTEIRPGVYLVKEPPTPIDRATLYAALRERGVEPTDRTTGK